jgi:hypothetical protein
MSRINVKYVELIAETSLLRGVQAQTLPDATPIGKIPPFIKIAVTFKPVVVVVKLTGKGSIINIAYPVYLTGPV